MELLEREGALAALGEAHDAAVLGAGRVVFVTGEAGIGKTSLVNEFAARPRAGRARAARLVRRPFDPAAARADPRPRRQRVRGARARARGRGGGSRRAGARARGARPPAGADGARARGRPLGRRRNARPDHRARPAHRDAPGAARPHLPQRRGAARAPAVRRARQHPARRDHDDRARAALRRGGQGARGRRRGRGLRRDRRQSVPRLGAARLRERPPSCRPRSRTRCSAGPRASTRPAGGWSSSSRSCPHGSGPPCSTR